jgi:VCBS repeat-containing protein
VNQNGIHSQTFPIGGLPPVAGQAQSARAESPVALAADTPITELIITDNVRSAVPLATFAGTVPVTASDLLFNIFLPNLAGPTYEGLIARLDDDTVVTGSAGSDGIEVGAGNDSVSAGGGDDIVLKWKSGNLVYDGGEGNDFLAFQAATGVVFPTPFTQQLIVDLTLGTGQSPYGGTLTLTSVEHVVGTSAGDIITGSDATNIIGDGIFDESSGDVIDARGGDDFIFFTTFNAFFPTRPGATIDGGAGFDTVNLALPFTTGGDATVIDLVNQVNNAGAAHNSTFANVEQFVLGSLAFVGMERLFVSDTSRSFDGGAGDDRVIFAPDGGVAVLDLAAPTSNTRVFANATFANFEAFEMAPGSSSGVGAGGPDNNFAFDFRGDGAANRAVGGDQNDTFLGRGGNDVLSGGRGGDLYIHAAGDGSDTIMDDGLAADISGGLFPRSQTDVLRLTGLFPADVALTRAGNDLLVTLAGTGEVITVVDHFLGGARGLEEIQFAASTFNRQAILDNLAGGTPDASPTVTGVVSNSAAEGSGIQIVNLLTGASDADGDTLHVANVNGLGPGMTLIGDTLQVDRSDPAFESQNAGGLRFFQVTYDIVDGRGGSVGQRAQIAVVGANDAAIIEGLATGSVTEDGLLATDGFLSASDIDVSTINGASEAQIRTQSRVATTFGTFSFLPDGQWGYILDNANPAVQALNAGETLTDIIPVTSLDGTTTNVTITINGASEPFRSVAYRVILEGSQQVPPVASAVTGLGTAVFDSVTGNLSYDLSVFGFDWGPFAGQPAETPASTADDVNGFHIHSGVRGINGGIVLDVGGDGIFTPVTGPGRRVVGEWSATDPVPITPSQAALAGTSIGADAPFYFNVHTVANGTGEIRGQLVAISDDNANTVPGTEGDDILPGLAGNDAVFGAGGADRMDGGDGDDILIFDNLDTSVLGGAGLDRAFVYGTAGVMLDLGAAGIEGATGAAGSDVFTAAGSLAGVTLWGQGGADQLTGSALDDVIFFDAADTLVQGGGGTDFAWAFGETAGVSVNLALQGLEIVWGGEDGDVLDGSGATVGVQILGFGGDDIITGGIAGDVLIGGDGADQIDGGGADDLIYFDLADTLVAGGAGFDRAYANNVGTNAVTVNLLAQGIEEAWGGFGADTLNGAGMAISVVLVGLGGADTLTGGDANDTLSAGDGDDLLTGGLGSDTIFGEGGAGDVSVFAGAAAEYAVVNIGTSVWAVTHLATGDVDTLYNVEFARFTLTPGDVPLP